MSGSPSASRPLPARYNRSAAREDDLTFERTPTTTSQQPRNPVSNSLPQRPSPQPVPNTQYSAQRPASNDQYTDYSRSVYSVASASSLPAYDANSRAPRERPSMDSINSRESTDNLLNYTYPRSTSEKFYVSADPTEFYQSVYDSGAIGGPGDIREDDDYLHNPTPRDLEKGHNGTIFTRRGLANLGCLLILLTGITALFAGFPLVSHFTRPVAPRTLGAYNLGGINASGQVPQLASFPSLIDRDTPSSAFTHTSLEDSSKWDLVFSDEFNTPNRTFYPGDDPYWEAVDLHYYATGDLEWYDPVAITTAEGSLVITLDKLDTHALDYQGGMLQSWNKFCFTGGYVEVSVSLPGLSSIPGLWPAVWTMGNLGRAGYGSTTDGTWPYSYDSCDVGTLHNQTLNNEPAAALTGGDPSVGGALSFLPGQRLSACTCPGEDHPGPTRADGSFVGRSAPEIDVLEAIVNEGIGQVSQSAQWAPYDDGYNWANSSTDAKVLDTANGAFNTYRGGAFQESTSGLFTTDQSAYSGFAVAGQPKKFATYGFEYKPGPDGYITWVQDGKPSWTVRASAVGANPRVNIAARPIPQEPMYLLANLGISPSFGFQSPALRFPASFYIDYVRLYQNPSEKNIGCSPPDFPTADYITKHANSYNNPNITTWAEAGQSFPKNRLIDTCT